MLTVGILLAIVGTLGAFDIAYFHHHRAHLSERPASRREAWIHVARGLIYTLQFALVPNVKLTGVYYTAFIALFICDATIAVLDVLAEPDSRRELGGLFRGEYLAHIVLSVLIGAMLHAFFSTTHVWMLEPSAAILDPTLLPRPLALALTAMALGCFAVTIFETAALIEASMPRPRPLHIRAKIDASLEELWAHTQDHRAHPAWDHRFSRITMLEAEIKTGTRMTYERDLFGGLLTIRGFGRYKLHRPMKQSTFEFWSDDPRSLIRRGTGLWLYRPLPDGAIDFFTAYDYRVRWGAFGRIIDRLIFRPLILRVTEESFRRLEETISRRRAQARAQPAGADVRASPTADNRALRAG